MTARKSESKAAPEKKALRILHFSDTHMLLTEEHLNDLPDADIFIHTGDFTDKGDLSTEFRIFNEQLGKQFSKYPIRIVILGNHDCYKLKNNFSKARQILSNATHLLCHEEANVCGLRIYGCPWFYLHRWDYGMCRKAPDESNFHAIPENLDILLTHGPPYKILDEADGYQGNYSGSEDLHKNVIRAKPKLHLFGHIHEMNGVHETKDTTFINSAMKNRWGKTRIQNWCRIIDAVKTSSGWTFKVKENETKFSDCMNLLQTI